MHPRGWLLMEASAFSPETFIFSAVEKLKN
jgi:hypothetical protein